MSRYYKQILFMNVFASIMHQYVIIVICYVMWICVFKEVVKSNPEITH